MSVEQNQIVPGTVFQVGKFHRRIVNVTHHWVFWEYADGVKRSGRSGGKQWKNHFASSAKPLHGAPEPTYAELEQRIAELETLCSVVYQIVGALDGPGNALDYLLAAAQHQPLPGDPMNLLPYARPSNEERRT